MTPVTSSPGGNFRRWLRRNRRVLFAVPLKIMIVIGRNGMPRRRRGSDEEMLIAAFLHKSDSRFRPEDGSQSFVWMKTGSVRASTPHPLSVSANRFWNSIGMIYSRVMRTSATSCNSMWNTLSWLTCVYIDSRMAFTTKCNTGFRTFPLFDASR